MGTRADFYRGGTDPATMLWLGSIAWDGYPDGLPLPLLIADDEVAWVAMVLEFVRSRDDGTHPEQGWPWPWPSSETTDWAYTWTPDGVRGSSFGGPWHDPRGPEIVRGQRASFPDMTAIQKIAWDGRSGVVVVRVEGDVDDG